MRSSSGYLYVIHNMIAVVEEMKEFADEMSRRVTVETILVIEKMKRWEEMMSVSREESKEAFELKKLRHEYQVRFGRKPFGACGKEQILAKLQPVHVKG